MIDIIHGIILTQMGQQTEAPFSSDQEHAEEEIEWVSKTQLKRDSKALQDLGKKLSQFNPEQLAKIPLNDELLDAIQLAHKIANKRGALKRHYQYIGKLLRNIDPEPIWQAVAALEQVDTHNRQLFKQLENWRDRILAEGDSAIQALCAEHGQMDRQKLRQLWRNHQSANEQQRTRIGRQLFRELRDQLL